MKKLEGEKKRVIVIPYAPYLGTVARVEVHFWPDYVCMVGCREEIALTRRLRLTRNTQVSGNRSWLAPKGPGGCAMETEVGNQYLTPLPPPSNTGVMGGDN